jgi:molecular chaperone DnaJ
MTSTANASSIAIAERYAREYFGLSLPLTSDELKSAFRRMAKELHTDTSGDQKTKDKFIAMKYAYDFLVRLDGMKFVYGDRAKEGETVSLATTDGTQLYELGLGLGHLKNGRDCERCQHKGYTEEEDFSSYFNDLCRNCNSTGRVRTSGRCNPCGGTGKFKQLRSQRVVTCRVCMGSGGNQNTYQTCTVCNGSGRKKQPKKVRYAKCYECNGTGEIELFSPLFPKGRMINKVKIR